jgi:hypothetical protein
VLAALQAYRQAKYMNRQRLWAIVADGSAEFNPLILSIAERSGTKTAQWSAPRITLGTRASRPFGPTKLTRMRICPAVLDTGVRGAYSSGVQGDSRRQARGKLKESFSLFFLFFRAYAIEEAFRQDRIFSVLKESTKRAI